jgi:HD-like signal output (HDOD) protein
MSNIPPPRPRAISDNKEPSFAKGEAILRRIGIPSQPYILVEIDRMIKRPGTDLRLIGDLVAKDVSLSAKVIKLASSPMFGGGHQFHSIKDALLKLGIKNFVNGVLSIALRDSFSKFGNSAKEFWKHSNIVAALSQEIAKEFHPEYADDAYTIGLFHDMASVMLQSYEMRYRNLVKRTLFLDLSVTQEENTLIQSDHAAVGYLFAKTWSVPDTILEVIQHHHNPSYTIHKSPEVRILKAILQLAELFYMKEAIPERYELTGNPAESTLLDAICEQLEIDRGYDLSKLENRMAPILDTIHDTSDV